VKTDETVHVDYNQEQLFDAFV